MAAIGQSNLLQALGWAVFNSLWQMAILWVAYQLIVHAFRIKKSSNRSFLSSSLLFTGFAWFIFTFVSIYTDVAGPHDAGIMNISSDGALNTWLNDMLPLASVLYLLLLVLPVLNFIRNYRYVQVIRRYGLTRAGVQWRMFVQKTAAQMGIRKPVHIWMSELVTSPVTIGYIKPVILLPLAAINHLNTQQIEAVLLHELAHIRRYDYFINLLSKLIQTVLYFNPFVKAFARIIETEREKSCDETVIQFQYEPHGYATALLVLEKAAHVSRHSLAVGASDGKKSEFRQRIEWIMGINKKPVFSFNKLAGVMAALLCFIVLNAFLIISNPNKNAGANESFSFMASPYEFFDGGYDKTTNGELMAENVAQPIVNLPVAKATPSAEDEGASEEEIPAPLDEISALASAASQIESPYHFVTHLESIIPKLTEIEEKQIQQAIVESRKVMQENTWKAVEQNIADVLTRAEKENVKEEYKKAISKLDWNKISNNLRIAYDNIDWKRINTELDQALAAIQIDSLHQAYTIAMDNLCKLESELEKANVDAIPDSDITLQSIETKKCQVQKAINQIKRQRPRKIVEL